MKNFNSFSTSFTDSKKPNPKNIAKLSRDANTRIITKNVLYLIGIPLELANKTTLSKIEYLGQYGSISKILVNKNGYMKNESDFPTYSTYVTFSNEVEASLALLALDNSIVNGFKLNACYGTNKYCNFFLNGIECNNKNCFFLHEYANENDFIINNDSSSKLQFFQQQKIAMKTADIFSPKNKKYYLDAGSKFKNEFVQKKIENFFPTIDTIYNEKRILELTENNMNFNEIIKKSSTEKNKNNHRKNGSGDFLEYTCKKENDSDDEIEEYILERQPSRHKKYTRVDNKKYRNKHYKIKNYKMKQTLEKYWIKYKIKNSTNNAEYNTNSTEQSNSFNMKNENENENENEKKENSQDILVNNRKNLFKSSAKSRFAFVEENKKDENKKGFEIPEYINTILNKKMYYFSFLNYLNQKLKDMSMEFMDDYFFKEENKLVIKWIN